MVASILARACPIEDPAIDVPWSVAPATFLALVGGAPVTKLTDGHYRLRCRALGGLCEVFHFHFRGSGAAGRLAQVELLRTPKRHRQRAYDEMQARLERLLGTSETLPPRTGFQTAPSRWRVGRLTVTHEWYYHGAEYQRVLVTLAAG
jgi:hypothetical protein